MSFDFNNQLLYQNKLLNIIHNIKQQDLISGILDHLISKITRLGNYISDFHLIMFTELSLRSNKGLDQDMITLLIYLSKSGYNFRKVLAINCLKQLITKLSDSEKTKVSSLLCHAIQQEDFINEKIVCSALISFKDNLNKQNKQQLINNLSSTFRHDVSILPIQIITLLIECGYQLTKSDRRQIGMCVGVKAQISNMDLDYLDLMSRNWNIYSDTVKSEHLLKGRRLPHKFKNTLQPADNLLNEETIPLKALRI